MYKEGQLLVAGISFNGIQACDSFTFCSFSKDISQLHWAKRLTAFIRLCYTCYILFYSPHCCSGQI